MNREARTLGYYSVFLLLNVTLWVALAMGFDDSPFANLYWLAYAVLHLANFFFDGFGIGDWIYAKNEARRFRKQLNKEAV